MQEWSLVVYLFRWLKIQTTFKIDSIPWNCVCIFKRISKQYCLDYYIKRRGSSFTETYRVFCERRKRVFTTSTTIMNRWNRVVRPSGMHLMFWTRCILSFQHFWTERFKFSRHLIYYIAGKNVLFFVKRVDSVRGNTLLVLYLFVWESCKWNKQCHIFNNSSMLQMLGKDHAVFLKKDFKFFFQAQCL